jgi:hypothetical protein
MEGLGVDEIHPGRPPLMMHYRSKGGVIALERFNPARCRPRPLLGAKGVQSVYERAGVRSMEHLDRPKGYLRNPKDPSGRLCLRAVFSSVMAREAHQRLPMESRAMLVSLRMVFTRRATKVRIGFLRGTPLGPYGTTKAFLALSPWLQ